MTSYEGGCHCGAVRYRVTVHEAKAVECNCSICSKKGFIHVIVDEADFDLVCGQDNLTTYTFGTHTAKHHFCTTCGVHSFYGPRSHPDAVDVNLRCLDDVNLDAFDVQRFDGKHWEEAIQEI